MKLNTYSIDDLKGLLTILNGAKIAIFVLAVIITIGVFFVIKKGIADYESLNGIFVIAIILFIIATVEIFVMNPLIQDINKNITAAASKDRDSYVYYLNGEEVDNPDAINMNDYRITFNDDKKIGYLKENKSSDNDYWLWVVWIVLCTGGWALSSRRR